MEQVGIILKRTPCQVDPAIRQLINTGKVLFSCIHLSNNTEYIRQGIIGPIDFAIIEASAITEDS